MECAVFVTLAVRGVILFGAFGDAEGHVWRISFATPYMGYTHYRQTYPAGVLMHSPIGFVCVGVVGSVGDSVGVDGGV